VKSSEILYHLRTSCSINSCAVQTGEHGKFPVPDDTEALELLRQNLLLILTASSISLGE
jgi:hypothetical protein